MTSNTSLKVPKILMVDDREDNLLAMEAILSCDGYVCVRANSGWQALKILLEDPDFAMILMDVKMPNLSGFETASLVFEREKTRHIPIVFVTANNYGEDNIYRGHSNGVDYLAKPVNPELLRAKVGVCIDLYKKNCQLIEQEQRFLAVCKNLEKEIHARKASEEKLKQLRLKIVTDLSLSRISS
jgi:CheY-like chemotaxis protein